MSRIESYSTSGVDPRKKLTYWNDCASECFLPLVCDPIDAENFNGSISRATMGECTLSEVSADSQTVRHTREFSARVRTEVFYIFLQMQGDCIGRQGANSGYLSHGAFALYDGTRAYEAITRGPNRMLVLALPTARLRRYVPHPEDLVARPMSGIQGEAGLFSHFLQQFWIQCQNGIDPLAAERITAATMELLSATYERIPRNRDAEYAPQLLHRSRLTKYIDTHLSDPGLTVGKLADACKISIRYVHKMFSEGDETVGQYILRRRLEACAQALRAPRQQLRTIAEIAYEFGFNSPTHFCRTFRAQFGMRPSDYRTGSGKSAK
jgi:AraC-like DNA-binding protein